MTPRSVPRRRAMLVLLCVGVVLGAAACTSSSTAAPSNSAGASPVAGKAGTSSAATASGPLNSATNRSGVVAGTSTAQLPTTPVIVSSRTPPPTTPVPVSGGGNINKTVPSAVVTTAPPVPVGRTAAMGGKVSATVALVDLNAVAKGPGEVSGPAVAVTVHIVNGTAAPLNVSDVAVSLTDKAGTPGNPMSGSPASPFLGQIGAGKTAVATYVFALSRSRVNPVSVSLSYSTEAPVVVFVGDAK